MAQVAQAPISKTDTHQKFDKAKIGDGQDINNFLPQQEALRRATLLKHRKVSTQLKLDMVQRQLNNLRRTVPESENDRQFYRQQMSELSNELQDLGSTLEKVERSAYYARRRMLRHYGTDFGSTGALHLSSSHPAIYSSSETLSQSSGRNSLKKKVYHMMSSPTEKLKKRHLFGELRAVASLSSLNIKSTSHASCEDFNSPKDAKPWKGPFKFLGNLMDSRIRRKLWGSTKRIKSEDNILEEKKGQQFLGHQQRL